MSVTDGLERLRTRHVGAMTADEYQRTKARLRAGRPVKGEPFSWEYGTPPAASDPPFTPPRPAAGNPEGIRGAAPGSWMGGRVCLRTQGAILPATVIVARVETLVWAVVAAVSAATVRSRGPIGQTAELMRRAMMVTALCLCSSARADEAEDKAVAHVVKFGGTVIRDDKAPGKPVLTVKLNHSKVTDAGLKELTALQHLAALNLGFTQVTDAGLKELAALERLTNLELAGTRVTDAGLKELAALKNLTKIGLAGTQTSDAGVKELAALKGLTKIVLGRQVTDAGLKELAALKNLANLGLSGTRVTGEGLKELAALENLTQLTLHGGQVTDAGARALTSLGNLTRLNLAGTHVTDAVLKELAALKNLTELTLIDTKVTDAGVKELQKALPNCRIEK